MTRQIDRNRLDNLARLIAEAGSAEALARRSGSSSPYLSQIRGGTPYPSGRRRRLGDQLAEKLERAMKKPEGWMDEAHDHDEAAPGASWTAGGGCPLISWVQAGAWTGAPEFPDAEARLHCPARCGPETFVLRVRGESMAPRFDDGDLIYVDPGVEARSGSFVVVRDGAGEATFKQLVEEDGRRYLRAANPDWPNPIVEARPDAALCGVVVFRGSRI